MSTELSKALYTLLTSKAYIEQCDADNVKHAFREVLHQLVKDSMDDACYEQAEEWLALAKRL